MTRFPVLPSAAAISLLLLAGCNQKPASDAADTASPAADQALVAPSDAAATDSGDVAAAAPVAVPAVPVPANASGSDAAPLVEAAAVANAISEADNVERVPYQDGWAWRRGGQIVRTASRDGRRVAYYRAGQSSPYLVQDNGRTYSYAGGRMQHSYDRDGHSVTVDESRRREGDQLARQSSQQHDEASRFAAEHPQQVQRETPRRGDHGRDSRNSPSDQRSSSGSDHPADRTHPTPTPMPSASSDSHGRSDHRNSRDDTRAHDRTDTAGHRSDSDQNRNRDAERK